MNSYFSHLSDYLFKPELRCAREMIAGILENGIVLVNQIASGIDDSISLSKTAEEFNTNRRNSFNR